MRTSVQVEGGLGLQLGCQPEDQASGAGAGGHCRCCDLGMTVRGGPGTWVGWLCCCFVCCRHVLPGRASGPAKPPALIKRPPPACSCSAGRAECSLSGGIPSSHPTRQAVAEVSHSAGWLAGCTGRWAGGEGAGRHALLPPPHLLAKRLACLTCCQRLRAEWRLASRNPAAAGIGFGSGHGALALAAGTVRQRAAGGEAACALSAAKAHTHFSCFGVFVILTDARLGAIRQPLLHPGQGTAARARSFHGAPGQQRPQTALMAGQHAAAADACPAPCSSARPPLDAPACKPPAGSLQSQQGEVPAGMVTYSLHVMVRSSLSSTVMSSRSKQSGGSYQLGEAPVDGLLVGVHCTPCGKADPLLPLPSRWCHRRLVQQVQSAACSEHRCRRRCQLCTAHIHAAQRALHSARHCRSCCTAIAAVRTCNVLDWQVDNQAVAQHQRDLWPLWLLLCLHSTRRYLSMVFAAAAARPVDCARGLCACATIGRPISLPCPT